MAFQGVVTNYSPCARSSCQSLGGHSLAIEGTTQAQAQMLREDCGETYFMALR